MTNPQIPDLETVASPPRCELSPEVIQEGALLGRGAQAVVYEATVTGNRAVDRIAVKQPLDPETLTREPVESFLAEASKWATVDRRERTRSRWDDSEHIVGVVDTGEELPWIAIEYMDGGSLADRLDGTEGLPREEALWVSERLARGVELAHNEGTAHLDLKPGNVLFRETGPKTWDVPKIGDWGLARHLATESGSMEAVSAAYAAPEQFAPSEFGDPGTLTDVYQLGAVVYALLTGRPPYTGGPLAIQTGHTSAETPPPPSQRRSGISRELDAVVQTALEPRKSDRYGSIETFKRALRAIRLDSQLPPVVTERIESTEPDPVARWPMFGRGPARTGAPDGHSGPDGPVTTRWQFGTSSSVKSSPAVVDGTVYVGSHDESLYAVDAATGQKQWQFDTDGRVRSSPAVVDGTVYVGSYNDSLYAVDAANGEQQWQFDTSGPVDSSPAVVDDTVYVGSGDGSLYALDAATGQKQWQLRTAGSVRSSPAVVDGTVYVGTGAVSDDSGSLYALDAATGQKQWQFDTSGWVYSSPAVADGTVYVGSRDSSLYAVDATTGKGQWKFDTSGSVESSPAVVDGTVYVGNDDHSLYAVDAATGQKQWQFHTSNAVRSSPAVVDSIVYVGSGDGSLYAVNAAIGTGQWKFNTSGVVESSPAVVDGTVYVGSRDHSLYAIESAD